MLCRAFSSISQVMSTPMARPAFPDPAAGLEHVKTTAAAEIHHDLPFLQGSYGQGIAAGKSHIGAFRQILQALLIIPHGAARASALTVF